MAEQQMVRELEFQDMELARELFGSDGKNLSLLQERLQVEAYTRGGSLTLSSSNEQHLQQACNCLLQMYELLRAGHKLYPQDMECALGLLAQEPGADLKSFFQDSVFAVSKKKTVSPRTFSQRIYLQAIRDKELVFGIGPAGTGKTYLAVAMAVAYLMQSKVKRLILTRPALEAGEKLGFLPGDIQEKINPYLRPLYDALHDMLEPLKVQEMLETGVIEIAPLAFMRGRTLNKAFIILDEAQNTTPEQMKMFLTRMGFGSKALVTGDITQIDLPAKARSGLIQAREVLQGMQDVQFVHFGQQDVIRHALVGKIVQAYAEYQDSQETG
ncbi:MAG: PhoH family protein, partial [Desulfohalobiaceae bacterium]